MKKFQLNCLLVNFSNGNKIGNKIQFNNIKLDNHC